MSTEQLEMAMALERMELYCMAHPGSPSAVRRPALLVRSNTWVALLGEDLEEGIAGFGSTVEEALAMFDDRYLDSLRAPDERRSLPTAPAIAVKKNYSAG